MEQDRFVVRPLSMAPEESSAISDREAEADRRRRGFAQRSFTMLAYNKEPLLLAQQRAAEEAGGERTALPSSDVVSKELAAGAEQAATAWAISGTCPSQYWSSPGDGNFKVLASFPCMRRSFQ